MARLTVVVGRDFAKAKTFADPMQYLADRPRPLRNGKRLMTMLRLRDKDDDAILKRILMVGWHARKAARGLIVSNLVARSVLPDAPGLAKLSDLHECLDEIRETGRELAGRLDNIADEGIRREAQNLLTRVLMNEGTSIQNEMDDDVGTPQHKFADVAKDESLSFYVFRESRQILCVARRDRRVAVVRLHPSEYDGVMRAVIADHLAAAVKRLERGRKVSELGDEDVSAEAVRELCSRK